jgi:hypothetical protein
MTNFFQLLQLYSQLILLFTFIFLGSGAQGIQSFKDTFPGFYKPRKAMDNKNPVNVPTDPRTNEEKKKDKEAADKKKEEDFKKIKNILWIASSIAGAVIMTWVIIKHWND